MGEMIEAFAKGDVADAPGGSTPGLIASYDFETGDDAPNPIPTKAHAPGARPPVGQCRPPMGPAPDGLEPTVPAGCSTDLALRT